MKPDQKDTIVALATPRGEGGIAVIRVSGPQAIRICASLLKERKGVLESEGYRAHHGWIVDGDEPVDEVVATVFRAPHSYTGEDVVEISGHGGTWVSRRILELLVRSGARPAEPGEFTQRAFLSGKLDLSQAEAVADLIQAKTEASRKVAVYQLEGRLSQSLKEMRESLIHACSLLEIELDFSEEDIEFASRNELMDLLASMKDRMNQILASYKRGRVCREGIRMVIVGKPNVGKSSILNALVEKERAIVTEHPGTTRDTVEDFLDIEGVLFKIIDTAGIRETEDPVEGEGVLRAKAALERSELVLLVLDGSTSLEEEDEEIVRLAQEAQRPIITVINKVDLDQRIQVSEIKNGLPAGPLVRVSALSRQGIADLVRALETMALDEGMPHEGDVVLTNVRHYKCLSSSLGYIENSIASLERKMSQEFVVLDLRGALGDLGDITGETTTDDILNQIFDSFCIGK